MNPANLEMLELAFEHLGELRDEVVFVGGATVELWITDAAAPDFRLTEDVESCLNTAILIPESRAPFRPARSRETELTSSFFRGFAP